jgi:hypothetical protein
MRLASILISAAILAGAPALAAPPPASPPPRDETDPQAKRITGSETYVPTFGLRASIARGFKVHGVLAVDAGLDVPDPKTVKRVEAMKPRIMAMMREAVLSYASLSYVVGERPDADMLRARLQKAVDGVMGKDEVKVALASVIVFKDER